VRKQPRLDLIIMIDLHCHILPDIDDGPQTWAESLEMARLAVRDAIHTLVAAPISFVIAPSM